MATEWLSVAVGLAALAAVTTPAAPPSSESAATYVASGGEPFWTLEIGAGRLRLSSGLGPEISIPVPRRERIRGGYRYRAPGLLVVIRHRPCEEEDARTYADTVHVTAYGYTARGCGGAWLGGAPLDGNEAS